MTAALIASLLAQFQTAVAAGNIVLATVLQTALGLLGVAVSL